MEHLNLVVGSRVQAEAFYQDLLGFSSDRGRSFHVNLGQQQLHLAESGDPAQVVHGTIGLAVPDLDSVRARAPAAAEALAGTRFAVRDDPEGRCLTVTCPWGNAFHLYSAVDDVDDGGEPALVELPALAPSESPMKMVRAHSEGGEYSPHRMSVRGGPGLRYVELRCPPGTAGAIGRFYDEMLGCTVSPAPIGGRTAVSVGPGVHLVFVEDAAYRESDARAMGGVHLCVYAHDFGGIYRRLSDRGLIWTNPRFLSLDSCDTWEEAKASRTLRFRDIIDLDTGEKIMELEHETRPLRHGQYLKVPHYEPK